MYYLAFNFKTPENNKLITLFGNKYNQEIKNILIWYELVAKTSLKINQTNIIIIIFKQVHFRKQWNIMYNCINFLHNVILFGFFIKQNGAGISN